MKDIILCEFKPKNFGQGLVITTNLNNKEGGVYQFNNLGDDGKLANFLIQDMIEGLLVKQKQQIEVDNMLLDEIEQEMERKAIANSIIEQS